MCIFWHKLKSILNNKHEISARVESNFIIWLNTLHVNTSFLLQLSHRCIQRTFSRSTMTLRKGPFSALSSLDNDDLVIVIQ